MSKENNNIDDNELFEKLHSRHSHRLNTDLMHKVGKQIQSTREQNIVAAFNFIAIEMHFNY